MTGAAGSDGPYWFLLLPPAVMYPVENTDKKVLFFFCL